jgi:6-phosphogluconolactonase
MPQSDEMYVYVGTYTGTLPHVQGKAKGIYVYRLDPETGALTYASQNDAGVNPSYVTVDANKRFLYAVDEHHIFENDSGAVSAYGIDPETKALTFLNRQITHGARSRKRDVGRGHERGSALRS